MTSFVGEEGCCEVREARMDCDAGGEGVGGDGLWVKGCDGICFDWGRDDEILGGEEGDGIC